MSNLKSNVNQNLNFDQTITNSNSTQEASQGLSPQNNLLNFALGAPECDNSTVSRVIDRLTIPILGAVILILLFLPPVDNFLAQFVPSFYHRLVLKAMIMLILLYLIDRIMVNWRENHPVCE